jgi:capsular polysaccharide biosynthesis protein
MINVAWNIEDEDRDAELTGTPRPLLGTWHYLHNSLRREWRIWMGLAVLGAYLGLAALVLLPPTSTGTVTLLMAHPANMDAPSAMATDVSLLMTREVAVRTVRELGLTVSPDAFQATVTAEPVTSEILKISVTGPDAPSAVAGADAVTSQYIAFRATQLRSLTDGLISGYKTRIASIQQQVNALNQEYGQVSQQGVAGQNRASEILTQRTELSSQITDMQQATEEATLQTDAAISSTHVIDPARALQPATKRAMVLNVGTGLMGGATLGLGLVLFRALTSERLRRRQEVAFALGAPVRFSVTSPGPPDRRFRRFRQRLVARVPWRRRDLDALVYGLESAVMARTGGPELAKPSSMAAKSADAAVAVAAIGNARIAAAVIAAVATDLRGRGLSVFLVDLSASGALVTSMSRAGARRKRADSVAEAQDLRAAGDLRGARTLTVFRPSGVPGLAHGPRTARGAVSDLPVGHALRASWDAADVVIALVEVDPGIDVENLRSWVEQVIPLVTAGRSTAELLETTAEMIRAAGLSLPFAMLVGAERTDESLGLTEPSVAEQPAQAAVK